MATTTRRRKSERLAALLAVRRLAAWADNVGRGTLTVEVRVRGEQIDTVYIDASSDDDETIYSVVVDTEGGADEATDAAEARAIVAEHVRRRRNARIEELAERTADAAREAVEGLLDAGRAEAVLAALRTAGLIG